MSYLLTKVKTERGHLKASGGKTWNGRKIMKALCKRVRRLNDKKVVRTELNND
jgi:hypothetical protein